MSEIEEQIIEVPKNYIQELKNTIKQLQKLVNMRLRTESSDNFAVLSDLNEKILNFHNIGTKIEKIYEEAFLKQDYIKQIQQKAEKYDLLIKRLDTIELQYQQANDTLSQNLEENQKKIAEYKQKELEYTENFDYLQIQLSESKQKIENQQNELELKDAEINRYKIEKESIQRQHSNVQSLLKQVNEEKDVQNRKYGTDLDGKLKLVKGELDKVKDSYQQKLQQKDAKIEKLERELKLAQNEIELNQEFTFLQSSVNSNSQYKNNFQFSGSKFSEQKNKNKKQDSNSKNKDDFLQKLEQIEDENNSEKLDFSDSQMKENQDPDSMELDDSIKKPKTKKKVQIQEIDELSSSNQSSGIKNHLKKLDPNLVFEEEDDIESSYYQSQNQYNKQQSNIQE